MRRTHLILAIASLVALIGCKRQTTPALEDVWDDAPSAEQTEATAALAPEWSAPTRAVLPNGLLSFWFHEENAVAFHARLLFSTGHGKNSLSAEQLAVVVEMLREGLERRLARYDVTVAVTHAPGRVEIAAHGRGEHGRLILRGIGSALSLRDPSTGLASTRDRLAKELGEPTVDEIAASMLAAQLLGLPPARERIDAAALARIERRALVAGWEFLTDPRNAIVVVHTGLPAPEAEPELQRMSARWKGAGRKKAEPSAVARMRRVGPLPTPATRLLADPPAPLRSIASDGAPVLFLGRVIPTKDPVARSLARLGQRVLQEDIDARLSISGDHALFVVRVPLVAREPDRSAEEAVDALSELARTRHQKQRLFQAAQLWLGARVVQASLDGEDWTALWSESIDLADRDEDIRFALARDAHAMLDPDPEAFKTWLSTWFDPRMGEPGWIWVVAGGDGRIERRLSRIAPVEPAR